MPDPSAPPTDQSHRIATGEADLQPDPLASLHRMSRTAGLGTQEYVAINPVAVTALLLGLASALALVMGLLLIVPAAGVVCAFVSLWQIRDSNGTQTGRGLAWSGLVLSVGFAVLVGTREIAVNLRDRADRAAVIRTVAEFGKKLTSGDIDGAYDMLSRRFKERLPKSEFAGDLKIRFEHRLHGKIASMASNGRIAFESFEQVRNAFATTNVVIQLEHRGEDRQQMGLSKMGDKWQIEGFGWFPPKPLAPARTPY